ncbi:MAG: hypothetical protein HY840_05440, partial [Bacteroidetes bacterium]|nr:hypothetical protein [Bacteroidota bacterium]
MKNIILTFFIFSLTVSLFAQKTPVDAGNDTTVSLCPPGCANLKAAVVPGNSSSDYTIDSIPYAPEAYNAGTSINFSNANTVSSANPIGFTFCFFGEPYTNFYIGSNGWIGFSPNQTAYPTSMFSNPPPIPDTDSTKVPRNAIFWLWSNLSIYGYPGVNVYYQMYGTPPNRKMVVSFYETAPHCLTAHVGPLLSGQIIIYETTNIIELFTDNISTLCKPGTPREVSVQGLLNKYGTKAVVDPSRNATNWAALNDGVRYTPIGGTASYTLNWFKTDTTSANKLFTDIDTSLAHPVCPSTTTSYISQLISNSCPIDTFYDTVVVNTSGGAFPHTLSQSQPGCGQANGKVKITLTGGTPNFGYVWKDALGNVIRSNPGTVNTTDSIINLAAGKYYITATESGGCIAKDSVTLISPSTPTPTITGGPLAFCQGSSITLDAGSGYASYAWLPGNQTSQTITVTTSGTFSVTVTNASGCTGSDSAVTSVGSVTATVTPSAPICSGQTATLTATGGTSYTWINLSTNNSIINVSPASTTTYSVIVTNGSCSDTGYSTVTVKPLPVITASPGATLCVGDVATLTASSGNGAYSWSNSANTPSITANANA